MGTIWLSPAPFNCFTPNVGLKSTYLFFTAHEKKLFKIVRRLLIVTTRCSDLICKLSTYDLISSLDISFEADLKNSSSTCLYFTLVSVETFLLPPSWE